MARSPIQPPVLHQIVYELRYDYGYTYLDKCGAAMNDVLRANPGWEHVGANPQQGALTDPKTHIRLTFNAFRINLIQEQSKDVQSLVSVPEFAKLAQDLSLILTDRLGLQEFTRVGFRTCG